MISQVTKTEKGLHCGECQLKAETHTGVDSKGNKAHYCKKFSIHVKRDYNIEHRGYLRCDKCLELDL